MATQSQQMNVIFIPGVNLKQVYHRTRKLCGHTNSHLECYLKYNVKWTPICHRIDASVKYE